MKLLILEIRYILLLLFTRPLPRDGGMAAIFYSFLQIKVNAINTFNTLVSMSVKRP